MTEDPAADVEGCEITYIVIILILFIYNAYTDIKNRKVMMIPVYTCFAICIIEAVAEGKFPVNGVIGMIPGILLLLISKITKEDLGSGDAYLVMAAGFMAGAHLIIRMIIIASALAFIFAVLLRFFKRIRCKSIPFVPFLLCGYLSVLFMWTD